MKLLPTGLLFVLAIAGCARYTAYPTSRSGKAATRDAYEDQVLRSAVGNTPEYAAWSAAGRRALRDRLTIRPSFRELLFFAPDRATAIGYRLELRRGQRVTVDVERRMTGRVFVEVFEEIGAGAQGRGEPVFRLVHSAPSSEQRIVFEARTDGPHVLRLQPELFKSGEVAVNVSTAAALTFPVSGRNSQSIGSFFGDARDGGKRDHEGIDIFAPAGTRVLAVAPGIITAVSTTSIGGHVVWQQDHQRNVTYYYAHLKAQTVRSGDQVNPGDEIGTVGNTGNARTTRPHLHFAVYRPGRIAIDPVPFLFDQPSDVIQPVLVDLAALGDQREVAAERAAVRSAPDGAAATVTTAARHAPVFVIGGVRDWYRVLLADGRAGFVRGSEIGVGYSTKGAN